MIFPVHPPTRSEWALAIFCLSGGAAILLLSPVLVTEFGADLAISRLVIFPFALGSGLVGASVARFVAIALRPRFSPILSANTLEIQGRNIPITAIECVQKRFETLEISWRNGQKTRRLVFDLRFLEKPNEFLEELEKRGVKLS